MTKRTISRLACIAILALAGNAIAAPANVIVLPTDGDADAALRTGITNSLEKVRKTDEGTVKIGGTTFAETAAAAGCDPGAPACAETVRTTLGVDELVYAMANNKDGQVVVVVHKKVKGKDPEEVTTTIAPTDPPDKIEPQVTSLIGKAVACPDNAVPGPDGKCPEKQLPLPPKEPRPYRNYAIIAGIGTGVLLLSGLAMWSAESSLQGQIDDTPDPTTVAEFTALKDKEDRASSRAWFGNFLIASSIGVGYLTYHFYKKDRRRMRESATPVTAPVPAAPPTVAPAPVPGGAMLVLRFQR